MTPSAQDFFLSFLLFSFLVSGRQVLGQVPDMREKKQSEIKILEEQFPGKLDLRNGTAACRLPPPLLYHSPSAERVGREKGKRDGSKRQTLSSQVLSSLAYCTLSGVDT